MIYQEGTYEGSGGDAKQEESVLAEQEEAGDRKVLRKVANVV